MEREETWNVWSFGGSYGAVTLERGYSGDRGEWRKRSVGMEGDFDNCFEVFFKIKIRSLEACC